MCKLPSNRAPYLQHGITIIVLILLISFFVSCTSNNKVLNLLGNDLTLLPCWRSICPGESPTLNKVVTILRSTEGTSNIEHDLPHHQVHFQWNDLNCTSDSVCSISGTVEYSSTDIDSIQLYLDYNITIGEFLANLGSPSCVSVMTWFPDLFSVSLDYANRGVVISLSPLANNTEHIIKSDMQVDAIYLVNKDVLGNCVGGDDKNEYAWRGFDVAYP
jgi:hypothetical protein